MDEINIEVQRVFEDLPKEERKLLREEFDKSVEPRSRILIWFGILLIVPMLISGGFSIYYMINVIFTYVLPPQYYICAAIFTISGGMSVLLSSRYHNRFDIWLRERKNIIKRLDHQKKSKKS